MTFTQSKKESRKEARYWKRFVMKRADHKCEICAYPGWPILRIHHIMPVARGGHGYPDNLLVICPNCHAIIHWLMSKAGQYEVDFGEIISPQVQKRLQAIAYRRVTFTTYEDRYRIIYPGEE